MKRFTHAPGVLALVLLVVAAAGAAAQRGPGTMHRDALQTREETTLSGRLALAEGELPVLVVGAASYTLRIPPVLAGELEVSNNASVTVTGMLRETPSRDLLTTNRVVMVRVFETGGTRHVLSGDMGRGAMGPPADNRRPAQPENRSPDNRNPRW